MLVNDLEMYKQKAEMSKQRATFFSPFSPVQTFSQEMLFKQPQSKEGIINADLGGSEKYTDLIKKMEKDLMNLKEIKKENEKLKVDLDKIKKKQDED